MLSKRALGSTGLNISALTLGTVKFGRNTAVKYPEKFELPDLKTCGYLLDLAYDLGFNIIDTAPAYGLSEQRLGEVLKKRKHQDWLICTKAGEFYNLKTEKSKFYFSVKAVTKSLENSLKVLGRDAVDIFLLHSDGNDLDILNNQDLLSCIYDFKIAGKIRSHGISSKTVSGGLLAAELLDVIMVTHNLNYNKELAVINKAHALNKGVLIKKGLDSGNFKNSPAHNIDAGIKFVLNTPGVSSLVIGSINKNHLIANANYSCVNTLF